MSNKSRYKKRPVNTSENIRAALTMFLWAYCEVHDPDFEDMKNMSEEIQRVQEGVMTGRLKLDDIRQALEEHLEELEDAYLAEERYRTLGETIPLDELMNDESAVAR